MQEYDFKNEIPTTEGYTLELEPQEEIATEPSYYERDNGAEVKVNVQKDTIINQAVSDYTKGRDLQEGFNGVLSMSQEEYNQQLVDTNLSYQKGFSQEVIKQSLDFDEQELENVLVNEQQRLVNLDADLANNPTLAPYASYIMSMEGSEFLSAQEVKVAAADMHTGAAIADVFDKMSKWDVAYDFLGILVAPDDNLTTKEFKEASVSIGQAEDAFNHFEFWNQYALQRKDLSPEEILLFDANTEKLLEGIDDNQMQQIMNMVRGIGHDPMSATDLKLEAVELSIPILGVGHAVLRNLAKFSKMVTFAKARDIRATKYVADIALRSNNGGAEVGVSQVDAALSGSSLNSSTLAPEISTGTIPQDMSVPLRNLMDNVDEHLELAEDVLDLDVGTLSQVEQDLLIEKVTSQFSNTDRIENMSVTKNGNNMEFTFDIRDEDGNVMSAQESLTFTKDDIGEGLFQEKSSVFKHALSWLASPNVHLGGDKHNFVELVEVALHQQSKSNAEFTKAFNAALKPIKGNRKSLSNLNELLAKTNGVDREFTYDDLVVDGYGGVRLNDKEFMAWKGIRRTMDRMWEANNKILRGEMELRGVKSVHLGGSKSAYVRAYDDAASAMRAHEHSRYKHVMVLDPAEGMPATFEGLSIDNVQEMMAKGYKLTKTDSKDVDKTYMRGNNSYRFAFVKEDRVGPLDDMVLNKQPNYSPISRKDANFFIRAVDEVDVDGVKKEVPRTIAFATTRKQALKFIQKENKVRKELGQPLLRAEDIATEGHVSMRSDDDIIKMNGGLVRGSRSSEGLKYAGDLDAEDMINDPLKTIQDAMNFTAKRIPMSRFRIGLQERVYNELDKIDKNLRKISWDELRGEIAGLSDKHLDNATQRIKLLNAYDQVDALVGVPAPSEARFQSLVRTVAKSFDNSNIKGTQTGAKWLYRGATVNPVQAIKSATYNLTLGTFNIVQLPIQMASATNAFAVAPVAFTKALPSVLRAATMDLLSANPKALKEMAKGKSTPKSFIEDYMFWKRTGLRESIVQAGGDYGSISRGMPYDAGTLRRLFGNVNEKGQMFFKSGELWNRRFSFFTALEEVKKSKGKNFKYDDDTLIEVMARQEKITLGMGAGNKAAFQTGLLSPATQFKQIYTKSIEAYTGDWFTTAEKVRMGGMQASLYGTAGIPVLNFMGDYLMQQIPGSDEWDDSTRTMFKRGTAGWLLNDHLDVDAAFSGRMTTSADLMEEIKRTIVDEVPLYKVLLGASGATVDRFWKLAKTSAFEARRVMNADDITPEMMMDIATVLGMSLAEIPAGSRNAVAAYTMHNEQLFRNSKGVPMWTTDASMRDVLARAIGYQSQEKEDLYSLAMSERAHKEKMQVIGDQFIYVMHKLATARDDDRLIGAYEAVLDNLVREMRGDLEGMKQLNRIIESFKDPVGKKEKLIMDAFKRRNSELVDAATKSSLLLKGEQ